MIFAADIAFEELTESGEVAASDQPKGVPSVPNRDTDEPPQSVERTEQTAELSSNNSWEAQQSCQNEENLSSSANASPSIRKEPNRRRRGRRKRALVLKESNLRAKRTR